MSLIRPLTRPVARPLTRSLTEAGVGASYASIVTNGVLAPFVTFTRSTTGTYFNSSGVMQTAAIDAPRIDYNPATLALRGLMVEEQRTNFSLRSQEFGNAYWPFTNITVTSDAISAPDGTTTADLLSVTANGAATAIGPNVTFTGTSATYSIYTKKGNVSTRKFLLRNTTTATNYAIATFNYDTGVISGTGWTATSVGNGWYRLRFVQTTGITSGDLLRVYVGATGDVDTAGNNWYVWGAQLEAGAYNTSYIPTVAATVTRAVDDADFTIPTSIVRLEYTYDDDTTADVLVTPGDPYTIPPGQKRIKFLRGYVS